MLRKTARLATVVCITYLMIELVCFVFIKTKFQAAHFPTFQFSLNYDKYDFRIAELNPYWGVWHYKNSVYKENRDCIECTYHFNSYGARDKERIRQGDTNRVIIIGDSFIEGYGMNENERLSNLLEKQSGKEFLNFACGWFTPTQEYLVYKHLASSFSHNTVMLGVLPFNDLNEDDSSFQEPGDMIHYRPFLVGTYPDYKLIYKEKNLSMSTFNREGYRKLNSTNKYRLFRFLREFTFWFNIYRYINSSKPILNNAGLPYSGYYDYTTQHLYKLYFIISKIKELAGRKRVILFTIPVQNDFLRYSLTKQSNLGNDLAAYCNNNDIEYIDLLPELFKNVSDTRQLYYSCDAHWNSYANKLAAEILLPYLQKQRP